MSLWLDFMGAEIRFVNTRSFGRVRLAEAGKGRGETIIFMHGVGGHLEAYAKNLVALSDQFHVVAFDFLGHGLSSKKVSEFTPLVLADQLAELMDELGIHRAHISGESLGGWVAGLFATRYPERCLSLLLNTSAGIPIISEKGRQDLRDLISLSARNANQTPTYDSVLARMQWLMHEKNWGLLNDELVGTRLAYYLQPDLRQASAAIGKFFAAGGDDYLIPLERVACPTLFLWTRDNPIHDLEAARAAQAKIAGAALYVMEADACHWPQYEAPEEFNEVARRFFLGSRG